MDGEQAVPLHLSIEEAVQHFAGARDLKRPTVAVQFRNTEVVALLDSGAHISCMNTATFRALPRSAVLARRDCTAMPMATAANGTKMVFKGLYLLQFKIKNLGTCTWPIAILDELRSAMILGADFQRACGAIIDYEDNSVRWRRTPSKMEDSLQTLALEKSAFVHPRSQQRVSVLTLGERAPQQTGVVSPLAFDCIESLEVFRHGKGAMTLINHSDIPMHLPKGAVVAQWQPVAESDLISLEEITEKMLQKAQEERKVDSRDIRASPREPENWSLKQCSPEKEEFLRKHIKLGCPPEWREKYMRLFIKYHAAFANDDHDLGHCNAVPHRIRMKTQEPVHKKQFRVPFAHQDFVNTTTDELLKKQVIESSDSPYNSPIFAVPKPHGGGLRLVQDLRAVNAAAYEDKYAFREVSDCVDEVGKRNSDTFSCLDFTSGYWQQELHPDSRQYTAFTVHGKGRFQWTRTVMGLSGAPASFSRLMEKVFKGVPGTITYLDDCLSHSPGHKTHLADLEECLKRCLQYNLKLNVKKCNFAAKEVNYLGFTLSGRGVQPGKEKTEAVRNFPEPQSVDRIRQFCGLANYFRHMIPNFARYNAVLSRLTSKDAKWKGGPLPPEARQAFQHLKDKLCTYPTLAHPRRNEKFYLSTDASAGTPTLPGGFGAVLTQYINNKERVIAYASRPLKAHEKNYSAFLLEKAAILWALEHFHVYLYDSKFIVVTDHRPLEKLSTVHKKTFGRLQEALSRYNCQIIYRPGKQNGPADALSRNPLQSLQISSIEMRHRQLKDPLCAALMTNDPIQQRTQRITARAWRQAYRQNCYVKDGVLYYKANNSDQEKLVVPFEDRHQLLRAAHVTRFAGHNSAQKMIQRLTLKYWWPGLVADAHSFAKTCEPCQESNTSRMKGKARLNPLEAPMVPNYRVHIDLFGGNLPRSTTGNKFILVITDAFTKLAELVPLRNKEARTVALAFFSKWICRHGVPKIVVSDRGTEFTSEFTQRLMDYLETDHKLTSAYHPQTNSSAESFNREIIRYIRVMSEKGGRDWESYIPSLMLAYNTRVHEATKFSPFFLTYGAHPQLPHFTLEQRPLRGEDWPTSMLKKLKDAFVIAKQNLETAALRNKQAYDKHTREQPTFLPGETAMLHFPRSSFNEPAPKFVRQWVKVQVVKQLGEDTYAVRKPTSLRDTTTTVHVNRLKKYFASPQEEVAAPDTNQQNEAKNRAHETANRALTSNEDSQIPPTKALPTAIRRSPRLAQANSTKAPNEEQKDEDYDEESTVTYTFRTRRRPTQQHQPQPRVPINNAQPPQPIPQQVHTPPVQRNPTPPPAQHMPAPTQQPQLQELPKPNIPTNPPEQLRTFRFTQQQPRRPEAAASPPALRRSTRPKQLTDKMREYKANKTLRAPRKSRNSTAASPLRQPTTAEKLALEEERFKRASSSTSSASSTLQLQDPAATQRVITVTRDVANMARAHHAALAHGIPISAPTLSPPAEARASEERAPDPPTPPPAVLTPSPPPPERAPAAENSNPSMLQALTDAFGALTSSRQPAKK